MFPRGYTTSGVNLWPGGVVEYNFVSDGSDSLKDAAFYVDDKVKIIFIMSRFMITRNVTVQCLEKASQKRYFLTGSLVSKDP